MKRIEVVVSGEHEGLMSFEIMSSIYVAIQTYGSTNISVQVETLPNVETVTHKAQRQFSIPEFMRRHKAAETAERR